MNRDTPQDETFKKRVREEFLDAIGRAQKMGYTVDKFAGTLGITRAGLHKYIRSEHQSIPSLRVLEKARRIWKVRLNYGDLGDGFVSKTSNAQGQLELQFTTADIVKENIRIQRVTPKGDNAVELLLNIGFAKRA
jgi:transcriptional regulator with XRE-family HTH domain